MYTVTKYLMATEVNVKVYESKISTKVLVLQTIFLFKVKTLGINTS